MVDYLARPRVGSSTYNASHTYSSLIALGAAGALLVVTPSTGVALVWTAHIGVDRAVGYGQRHPSRVDHTQCSGDTDHSIPAVEFVRAAPDAPGTGDD